MSCLLLWGGAAAATAAPTVAQMLSFRPKQEGVVLTTPAPQEYDACRVEPIRSGNRINGWLLRDPRGQIVRRFSDTNNDNKVDVWSYFHKGVEVYREIDANYNEKVDQYRWFHTGGMKWGVDVNEDGKIDGWKMISAEEVSQEILQAVVTKDLGRLKALMISEAEMRSLGMPAEEMNRIRGLQSQAAAKFQQTATQMSHVSPEARWLHLEVGAPQCQPMDETGMKSDLLKHPKGAILFETNGKAEWLQTGEMIQIGLAWRIVDAPVPGQAPDATTVVGGGDPALSAEMQALFEELRQLDEQAPPLGGMIGPDPRVARYQLRRADLLEKIAVKDKTDHREQWLRQVADCLSTAAQSSPANDRTALDRLTTLAGHTAQSQPGSDVAAYFEFRVMTAQYSADLHKPDLDIAKVQNDWLDRLAKFVQTYPKADDAADALMQLGMVSELMGKETEAKKWYEQLVKNFPGHIQAVKAEGAIHRLDLEGKVIELAGPVLGKSSSYDIRQHKGKVVVVYYWASWNQQCAGDFAKLKELIRTYGGKGLEVVCVNLDSEEADALDFLKSNTSPGTHLFKEGGLESDLAKQYGIMVLPTLFVVDKDGKVVSRTIQITHLEDEIKKQLP
ncbi:MAG: thioredoxin-like domain-containing protein [Gemmataceae bacterium]